MSLSRRLRRTVLVSEGADNLFVTQMISLEKNFRGKRMKSLFCLGQFLVVSLILLAPNYSDGYALVRFKLVTLLDVTGRLSSVSQSVSQSGSQPCKVW